MTEETDVVVLDDKLWQELLELTHGEAAPCFQCGVCTAICPWDGVREDGFNVRSILRSAQTGNLQELEPAYNAKHPVHAACPSVRSWPTCATFFGSDERIFTLSPLLYGRAIGTITRSDNPLRRAWIGLRT